MPSKLAMLAAVTAPGPVVGNCVFTTFSARSMEFNQNGPCSIVIWHVQGC